MSNFGTVLQQVSQIAGAVATGLNQVYGQSSVPIVGSVSGASAPAMVLPSDTLTWQSPAPVLGPVVTPVPTTASSGFMAALSNLWQGIVGFFKSLFGMSSSTATTSLSSASITTASVTSAAQWPAVNSDARLQAFTMFPSGNGSALGFVPVSVQRTQNAIMLNFAGFKQFNLFWQNNQLYYSENGHAPTLVSNMTSARQVDGSTQFVATLASGKSLDFGISADGHALQYDGFNVTLA